MPRPVMLKKQKLNSSMKTYKTTQLWTIHYRTIHYRTIELTQKNDILFVIGDWNAKVRSQEIRGITDKFGLGVQNETDQKLTKFYQDYIPLIANTLFQQHKRRLYTWTFTRWSTLKSLIIFFAGKDGEALYSKQKQDRELTVAQIMNSLLPNSDWNWTK